VCGWGGQGAWAPPTPGGFEGGATAPPRGAVGAEPQAKNAKLPIKHAFSHRKRGLRAGWESHPKMYVGKARPWSEVEVRGLEVNLGATKRTCAQPARSLSFVSSFCLSSRCRHALFVLLSFPTFCFFIFLVETKSRSIIQFTLSVTTLTIRSPQGASSATVSSPASWPHALPSMRR